MDDQSSPVTLLVRSTGVSLTFDVSEALRFAPSADITEHPLEDGTTVNDHAQIRSLNWTCNGGITETPYDYVIRGDSGAKTGNPRLVAALQFLRRVHGRERLFFSSTKTGLYADAMLASFDYEEQREGIMWFALAFKQIRIAQSTTVAIPATRPRQAQQVSMASPTDSGVQPTSANANDAAGGAILHGLFGAVGVDFGVHE